MANYTKITTQMAQEILGLYAIENITNIETTSSGISNTNYKVSTDKGAAVILKISNSKPYERIQQEQDILLYLHSMGFKKCLAPLKTRNGQQVYEHEGLTGVVYPFVKGDIPAINSENIYKIGEVMAELHAVEIEDKNQFRRFDDLGFGFQDIINYANSSDCLKPFQEFFHQLIDDNTLKEYRSVKHHQKIIHGDLYYDNCLFHNGELFKVLDFEQAGIGDPLLDMGISISGSCLVDGDIDKSLVKSFISGYESVRKLTEKEHQLIDFSIMMGLFSIALWRIERFNKNKIDSGKIDNYIELLKRAEKYANN